MLGSAFSANPGVDPFATVALTEALRQIPMPLNMFTGRFFKQGKTHAALAVNIFEMLFELGMAPFSARGSKATPVSAPSENSKFYMPGHIRTILPYTGYNLFKASPANPGIYMTANLMQKMASDINDFLMQMKINVFNTVEWMCAQMMSTGKIPILGDTVKEGINYQMPAGNKYTLGGATPPHPRMCNKLWASNGSHPLADLAGFGTYISQNSGTGYPDTWIFDSYAWDAFFYHSDVKEYFNKFNINMGIIQPNPETGYVATIMGRECYVNDRTVSDRKSPYYSQPHLPAYTVILDNMKNNNKRIDYGAVDDIEAVGAYNAGAAFAQIDFFSKSWVEKDPSAQMVLLETNPIPITKDIRGIGILTVGSNS